MMMKGGWCLSLSLLLSICLSLSLSVCQCIYLLSSDEREHDGGDGEEDGQKIGRERVVYG